MILYIKFDSEGIVNMYSVKERSHHIKLENYPKDFKQHPDYYQIKIENGEIVGIELREDLEEYKLELESLINQDN